MATVYKIEIETTSAWNNFSPKYVKSEIKKFLEKYEELNLENTKIKVERVD